MSEMQWLPLESNPTVMTKYLHQLGMPNKYAISDVYGLDEELLAMVPQPVYAMILLYPLKDQISEEFAKNEAEAIQKDGQVMPASAYFMKQFVSNACGTVALIHAVANSTQRLQLEEGFLKSFLDETKVQNPDERGIALQNSNFIAQVHDNLAHEGQTQAPERQAKLDTHFIAFAEVEGNLLEFDGRKKFPINHGCTTPERLLRDAAECCKKFMQRDPGESRFAMIALTIAD